MLAQNNDSESEYLAAKIEKHCVREYDAMYHFVVVVVHLSVESRLH